MYICRQYRKRAVLRLQGYIFPLYGQGKGVCELFGAYGANGANKLFSKYVQKVLALVRQGPYYSFNGHHLGGRM